MPHLVTLCAQSVARATTSALESFFLRKLLQGRPRSPPFIFVVQFSPSAGAFLFTCSPSSTCNKSTQPRNATAPAAQDVVAQVQPASARRTAGAD